MNKNTFITMLVFILLPINADAYLNIDLDTIIVTANRHAMEGQKVAGNVSVITQEQIEASNAQSVPDLLEQVQGVFIYDTSTTKTSVVDIRGFGDTSNRNVLVLVDGRRLNVADSGGSDLVQVPIGAIDRIEIIRGGGSVLYGDNAVGGVINIITKKGEGDISGKLGYFAGSYKGSGEEFQVAGEEKNLAYYFYAKYFDKRGYRKNSDELYKNFNGRLDYELNEKISFGVQYGFHEDSYELPGGLNQTEIAELSRRGVASNEVGNVADTEDQYVQVRMQIDPVPGDTYLGHFIIDGSWRDREVFDTFDQFDFDTNREVTTEGFALKYIFDQQVFNRDLDIILGFDKYRHSTYIFGSGTNTDDLFISKDEYGLFGNLEVELIDKFYFVGGSRYHKAEFTFDQRSGVPNFEKQKPDESVSSGGFKYEYGQGSNVFVNFQQTFRFLTPNEWYSSFSGLNVDLEQQRGKQFEFGVKHNINNQFVFSVTPYWLETENEIFFDPTLGFFGSNNNYDKIRRIGVEFGSRLDVKSLGEGIPFFDHFDKIEYFANYTFQNPKFTNGANDGKKVPFVPSHQANTGLIMRLLKHYNVSLIGRYVGSRYAINDIGNNLSRAKPFFITDLKLSYTRKNIEVFLAVNNLFDKKYNTFEATNSSLTTRDVYPAPEKNFLGGINIKF